MNVKIKIIPHRKQRYPTVGDWYFDKKGNLTIAVSHMSNWKHEMLVAIHELAEVLICKHHGVTQQAVDTFDKKFEKDREAGKYGPEDEPGDDPRAPYCKEHGIASGIERVVGAELGVDWNAYANEVESL